MALEQLDSVSMPTLCMALSPVNTNRKQFKFNLDEWRFIRDNNQGIFDRLAERDVRFKSYLFKLVVDKSAQHAIKTAFHLFPVDFPTKEDESLFYIPYAKQIIVLMTVMFGVKHVHHYFQMKSITPGQIAHGVGWSASWLENFEQYTQEQLANLQAVYIVNFIAYMALTNYPGAFYRGVFLYLTVAELDDDFIAKNLLGAIEQVRRNSPQGNIH